MWTRKRRLPRRARGSALSALELESFLAGSAIESGDATLASVQTRRADGSRGLGNRVISIVALADAFSSLEQQGALAGNAILVRRPGASFARRVTRFAVSVLVIPGSVAARSRGWSTQTLFIEIPAIDAARADSGGAARASRWTGNALATFFIRAVSGWTRNSTSS